MHIELRKDVVLTTLGGLRTTCRAGQYVNYSCAPLPSDPKTFVSVITTVRNGICYEHREYHPKDGRPEWL